jgi:hypothetical protein
MFGHDSRIQPAGYRLLPGMLGIKPTAHFPRHSSDQRLDAMDSERSEKRWKLVGRAKLAECRTYAAS